MTTNFSFYKPYALDIKIWQNYAPIPNSLIFAGFTALLGFTVRRVYFNTGGLLRSHFLMYCICLFLFMAARLSTQFIFGEPHMVSTEDDSFEAFFSKNRTKPITFPTRYLVNDGNGDLQYFIRISVPVFVYMSKCLSIIVYGVYLIWRAHHLRIHPKNILLEVPFWLMAISFLVFGVFKLDFILSELVWILCLLLVSGLLSGALYIGIMKTKKFSEQTNIEKYYSATFWKEIIFMAIQLVCMLAVPCKPYFWRYNVIYETSLMYSPILELGTILFFTYFFKASDFKSESDPPSIVINAAPSLEVPASVDGISNRSVDGSMDNKSVCSNDPENQDDVLEQDLEHCAHSVSGFESHTEESVERRPLLNHEDRSNNPNMRSPVRNYVHRVESEINEPAELETKVIHDQTGASPVLSNTEPLEETRCESTLPVGCYIENTADVETIESDDERPAKSEDSKMSVSTESLCSVAGISGITTEMKPAPSNVTNKATHSGELSSESDQEMEKIDKRNANEQDRASLNSFVYYD